jgi:hypothetical protein
MKVTFVGHASLLVEAGGISILSDPWWRAPCFGAQWWNYPEAAIESIEGRQIDYVYISHGHHDHFHPGTLRMLGTGPRILVSARTDLAPSLRGLGYQVIEVADDQALQLGASGVTCRIMETYGGDTLMTVSDGNEVCINLNDALHAAPAVIQREFVERLKTLHPRIDYLFCGYGVASHFPNCYVIPAKDRSATAARRQGYFNRQWAALVAELNPRFGFPFAADVVLLEDDLFWANEVTQNSERPTVAFRQSFPNSSVNIFDIAPGFTIADGQVIKEVLRKPVRAADLIRDLPEQIKRANRYGTVAGSEVSDVVALLQERLKICEDYLSSYPDDYRMLIQFRGSAAGVLVEKHGSRVAVAPAEATSTDAYDLIFRTRLPYLRWALTREYGDEILFVGSGGVFEYRRRADAVKNLHRELVVLLRRTPPPNRGQRQRTGLMARAKGLLRRLVGRSRQDLYDLGEWTVFESTPGGGIP